AVVRTEGDAFFAVFPTTLDAIRAAVAAQRGIAAEPWPEEGVVRVRMGLHTGEGRLSGGDYIGLDVHRAARIGAAGHGGQVLLSEAAAALAGEAPPEGVTIATLGRHRLKDFDEPQAIHQLQIDGLPHDFPPLKTLDVPSNLPTQLTTFVGRARELAEVAVLLEGHRLLTLLGPGGSGKTRLAVEVAEAQTGPFPEGVFFVDLTSIRDPDLVPSAVAQALRLPEHAERSVLETVIGYLRDRRALLVLDNLEHLMPARFVLREVLAEAPHMTVMVTSRTRLDLAGEQAYDVPPLELPDESAGPDALSRNEAMALFRERARAVRADFEIDQDNAAAVAAVCARLDGLPLAIELAAAQLRLMTPHELLARLEQHLPLRAGAVDAPERQRTLRGAIEWSYELLEASLRAFFARLSVFAGGATESAASAVANPGEELGVATVDGLATLLDHSLIRRIEDPQGSRFVMLETIREFAADRLRAEFDAEATERQHAEFFAALAETWGPVLHTPDGLRARGVLMADFDNVRAAIAWAVRTGEPEVGLRVAAPLPFFWVEHGHMAEGLRALEGLLDLPGVVSDAVRARALQAIGGLRYWGRDLDQARAAYEEALALHRRLGDDWAISETAKGLAGVFLAKLEADPALPLLEEALEAARRTGAPPLIADATGVLGIALATKGEYEPALEAIRESLGVFEMMGASVVAKGRMSGVLRLMGRLEEAEEAMVSGLASSRPVAEMLPAVATTTTLQLAAIASQRGNHERALRLAGFSDRLGEEIGGRNPQALILLPDPAEVRSNARASLDEETIERLWSEGAAMSQDEAIAYALGESP
ncbi:MAG TPA: tetratricopeptide repeat protein, partial [Actinomycetota bacterium]|nr:tetratricopeptide repeat protein [Actinomycetota bacterium]